MEAEVNHIKLLRLTQCQHKEMGDKQLLVE